MKSLIKYGLLLFLSAFAVIVKSEGWKQLTPGNVGLAYISVQKWAWCSSDPACQNQDRIHIHIENLGEKIYYGFNWPYISYTPAYVRILDPDGNPLKLDTIWPNVTGWIVDYNQASAGPNVIHPGGYAGFEYTPPTTGDYMFDIGYPDPIVGGSLMNFDVTVIDTTKTPIEPIDGRVYCQNWLIACGSGAGFVGTLYSYPNDSIVTSINFNGMHSGCLGIVMNRNGIFPPSVNWITSRRSLNTFPSWTSFHDFKIFLNNPDPAVYHTGILGEILPGSLNIIANCNDSVEIGFVATKAGHVEIQIQIDPDPGIQTIDTVISDSAAAGLNTIIWNGINGLGQTLQNGTAFYVKINYLNGLTNLPLNYLNNNTNGLIVQLHRPIGPTPLLYWDDRLIDPTNFNFLGCTSSLPTTGCHTWLLPPYYIYNIVNTWWYA